MSQVVAARTEVPSQTEGLAPDSPPSPKPKAPALIAWTIGASLLLIGSGVVRAVQSIEYAQETSYLVECPFPLNTVPRTIGDWQVVNGSEIVLDPLTTRISGSTDHVVRTYVDAMTGVMLSVMVLFGPAEPVLPHTPQICYPSSGYKSVAGPIDRDIKIGDRETAKFRASIFAKSGGRSMIRNAVYHSFQLDGPWTPAIATHKFPRKSPGIFKVQIQRRVAEGEKIEDNEPIEAFVQKLLPVLEKMTADAAAASTQTAPTPAPAGKA